jgi:alpha-tubulin suppressor-like RCC1 family protein
MSLVLAIACGDGAGLGDSVTAILVTPTAVSVAVGDTIRLTATGFADELHTDEIPGLAFIWSSSDPAAVTVTSDGVATGASSGIAHIGATAGGISGFGRVNVIGELRASAVTTGTMHSCALRHNGRVYCWGYNLFGELGDEHRDIGDIVAVVGDIRFTTVVAGLDSRTCGISTSATGHCWGENNNYALGTGQLEHSVAPTTLAITAGVADITAGNGHGCVVTMQSNALCWGDATYGEVGSGPLPDGYSPVPVTVTGGLTFSRLSAGENHTCGITPGGPAYCWGDNWVGVLGDSAVGTEEDSPVRVAGGRIFSQIDAGRHHTCALTSDGTGYCWGWGDQGQLGDGTANSRHAPVAITGGHRFTAISAGGEHTCGLTSGGAPFCWGRNQLGQLGTGNSTPSHTPAPVSGGLTFLSISAGAHHTCGVASSGIVYCWGNNQAGALGEPATTPQRNSPTLVEIR